MFCATLSGFKGILMCTASDLGCRKVAIAVEVCQRRSGGTKETKNGLRNIGFDVTFQRPVYAVSSRHDPIWRSHPPWRHSLIQRRPHVAL